MQKKTNPSLILCERAGALCHSGTSDGTRLLLPKPYWATAMSVGEFCTCAKTMAELITCSQEIHLEKTGEFQTTYNQSIG